MGKRGPPKGCQSPNPNGRPKGSVNERTKAIRAVANAAILEGITPLEVMLDNMRFYHERAGEMLAKILLNIGKRPPIELVAMLKELCSFRSEAQKCAADAAPFVHPKLASIAHTGKDGGPIQMISAQMSVEQAAMLYGDMIGSNKPPCLIEHEPPPAAGE